MLAGSRRCIERAASWEKEASGPFGSVFMALGTSEAVYEVAHRSNETTIRVCKVIQKSSADKAKTSHQRVREEFAVRFSSEVTSFPAIFHGQNTSKDSKALAKGVALAVRSRCSSAWIILTWCGSSKTSRMSSGRPIQSGPCGQGASISSWNPAVEGICWTPRSVSYSRSSSKRAAFCSKPSRYTMLS